MEQAAQLLDVSKPRVQQFIKAGRLPGAIKHQPHSNMRAFWKIPIASLIALRSSRISEGFQHDFSYSVR